MNLVLKVFMTKQKEFENQICISQICNRFVKAINQENEKRAEYFFNDLKE